MKETSEPRVTGYRRVRTTELKDKGLDWAIAKCEGRRLVFDPMAFRSLDPNAPQAGWWIWEDKQTGHSATCYMTIGGQYSPSTSWAQGGPIIDRECIRLDPNWRTVCPGNYAGGASSWDALHPRNLGGLIRYGSRGVTALEAVMRCFVFARLGEWIDLPVDLVTGTEGVAA